MILLTGGDGRPVWERNQEAWHLLHLQLNDAADWFFKADDDTCAAVSLCCVLAVSCVFVVADDFHFRKQRVKDTT